MVCHEGLGDEHPSLIRAHDGLAQALHAAGRSGPARQHWERVRALVATHLPAHHPLLATPLLGLAEIAMDELLAHAAWVRRLAVRLVHDVAEAEDLVQKSLETLVNKRDRFRGASSS